MGLPGRPVVRHHRRHRPRPGQRRRDQAVVRGLLGGAAPALDGRRVRQLHGQRREPGPRPRHLPRPLRPPRGHQADLRPGQLLPREPEHRTVRTRRPLSGGPDPVPVITAARPHFHPRPEAE
ncbi:hypothetical protein SCOCK_60040 [Actinacidiphila cocklensis]|uniref:Uncharacterized protein n=1 Tax=Actinacidiphila cocklensis TaxID=887465 RepID=A0A9W4GVA6_9ACTN|nr:hypothetical protein SCOCK_60040 [Actinacidiphila cocklensis]